MQYTRKSFNNRFQVVTQGMDPETTYRATEPGILNMEREQQAKPITRVPKAPEDNSLLPNPDAPSIDTEAIQEASDKDLKSRNVRTTKRSTKPKVND